MNKVNRISVFYRRGPLFLLPLFLLGACAGPPPAEIRYDEKTRVYTSSQNEAAGDAYTVSKYENATAYYNLRLGGGSASQYDDAAALEQDSDELKLSIEVDDVLFDTAKWDIKTQYLPELDRWVDFMIENPSVTAEIYGHTDNVGTTAYNKNLSEQRLHAVVNYLVKSGVESERLEAVGFGEYMPAASNATKEGRQKNRRVEFNL